MKLIEAIRYIELAQKEGFMSDAEAERLLDLPWYETIKEVEKLANQGDDWANEVVRGEL